MKRFAAGFQKYGVTTGDRICVHMSNSVEGFAAMYGCVFAGATLVMAKPSLTERELQYLISDSDCTHVLIDSKFAAKTKSAISPLLLKGSFALGEVDGFMSASSFRHLDEADFRECPIQNPRNVVLAVVYTSGTTGLPKGVELTQYSFVFNCCLHKARKVCDTSDVVLASAPITHLSGLLWGPICVLSGAKCIFTPPLVGLQDLVPIIKEYRVTRALFFPSQLRALCEEMQRSGERLDTIRAVAVAGAALTQAMYDAAFKAFGGLKRLVNVYTLTEAGGTLCTPSTDTDTDLGFPSAMNELKVVDITSRRTLGPREVGEICFRSPAVMRGYYKRPKDTAEFFESDGWCKTGDAGYYDESGRFHFVQRLKELIKCMDNQVVPGELEGLLLQEFATNISEVVVVGLDHPELGQAPAAAVLLKEKTLAAGDLTNLAESIKATIARNLAVHKHLHGGVFFLEALPKTDNGKVNRKALREICAASTPL
ncbi:hypothetical protein MTO96_048500 [Rhipicephalus appendiculatus]